MSKRETEPPANIDAERAILGAILLECSCPEKAEWMSQWEIASALDPNDFFLDSHRSIFLKMNELIEKDAQVDIVTLCDSFSREIASIGGVSYIASLTEGLPLRPNIRSYVKIVKAKSLLRKLMQCCTDALQKVEYGESGFAIIEALEASLSEIKSSAQNGIRKKKYDTRPA